MRCIAESILLCTYIRVRPVPGIRHLAQRTSATRVEQSSVRHGKNQETKPYEAVFRLHLWERRNWAATQERCTTKVASKSLLRKLRSRIRSITAMPFDG